MNNQADQENLLAEVLAEASPAAFRAALLAETLRFARRRRQFRQVRQVVGVLAVLGLLAVFLAQPFSTPPLIITPVARKFTPPGFQLVRTRPLPAAVLVSTRSFSPTGLAAPVPRVIEVTTLSGGFRVINDNELLALLADKPAVLIRTGPNSEELVFANPEDQKLFHSN